MEPTIPDNIAEASKGKPKKGDQAAALRKEIAKTESQIELDKMARNKAEKDVRDGLRRVEQLKTQLIDLLS